MRVGCFHGVLEPRPKDMFRLLRKNSSLEKERISWDATTPDME